MLWLLAPPILILNAYLGLKTGGLGSWSGVLLPYVILPILETTLESLGGPSWRKGQSWIREPWATANLVAVAALLTVFYAWCVAQIPTRHGSEFVALVFVCGSIMGILGITLAHELVHRTNAHLQRLGLWLLLLVNFPHWATEHVHGHHRHVATPKDPATARRDEWLYTYWMRSYWGGFRSAQAILLAREPLFWVRAWVTWLAPAAQVAALTLFFGLPGFLFAVGQSVVAIALLQTVDYIEHYGLLREVTKEGFGPVGAEHSWDWYGGVSNSLLFGLGFHANHHLKPRVPYQDLQPLPNARHMPYGYPAMVLLALIPPVFHRSMKKKGRLPSEPSLS